MGRFFSNSRILIAFCFLLLPAAGAFAQSELIYPNTEVPFIQPRKVWVNEANLANLLTWLPEQEGHLPPDYALVERIIAHDQGCGDPAACTKNATDFPVRTIQNIYRFHAVTRGWGDIGYNYIIDRQGKIYEGRFGGNGVRAAHLYYDAKCQNFNIGSAGVLLLGDLRTGPMTQEQQKSLERLSAWLGVTNGFDPSDSAKTSKVWGNPKVGSSCDLNRGGFTATFTGPALLSHGDIEENNSDKFDLSPLRPNAWQLAQTFKSYVYRETSDPALYTIAGGGLYINQNSQPTKIITLSISQLDLFPFRQVRALADGTLIKSANAPDVYVMEAGQRRSISAPILFALLGYRRENIVAIPERELALYPLGDPKPFPEGTLVQELGKEEVYVSKGGFLRHVSSAALFERFGFLWQKIMRLAPEDFTEMPRAEPLKFPDGALIKGRNPTVYLVEKEERRPIASASLFSAVGFKWADIVQMQDYELERYLLGPYVQWPEGTLIRAHGEEKVYLVQKGFRRWITTAAVFLNLGYRWDAVNIIGSDELASHKEGFPIAAKADLTTAAGLETPLETEGAEKGDNNDQQPANQQPPDSQPPVSPPAVEQQPVIRVGITKVAQGSATRLNATTYATVKKNGTVFAAVPANNEYSIPYSIRDVFRFEPEQGGVATVLSYEDRPAWNPSLNDNQFRGVIEVKADQSGSMWVINELPIEDYLRGVAETINGDPQEYGKAFAVAARSYALHYIEKGGKRAGEPFHLRRTSEDQLYKGYNFELRAKDPVAAVNATKGLVAVFPEPVEGQLGKPILAAYSSGAPGPTKSACNVWGQHFCEPQFDYLDGGVADPAGTTYQYQSCAGAVHCVGIDAAGARKMASLGSIAEQILKTYYPGITLDQRW